jgi:O-antigen/teichoic acid export membrane protein
MKSTPRVSCEEASLTSNAAWLALAKTAGLAFAFLLPVILVRQLSVSEFGLYRQVFLAVNTAMTTLTLGFATSAYYFFPREPVSRKPELVLNVLLFYLFVGGLAAAVILLRPGFLSALFNSPDMLPLEPWIGLTILFWVSSSFFEAVAIANGEARLAGAVVITTNLAKTVFMLGAAVFFGSVQALIYAALILGLLQLAILVPYLASRFPGMWRAPSFRLLRVQFGYVLPLGMAAVLWWFQTDLHGYVVSNRLGPAAYAVYSVGCLQVPLWGILLDSVGSVMVPAVSYLQSRNERHRIVVLTARMMRKVAALGLPLYFFLLVNSREFILVLFTERYVESWPVFAVSLTLIPLSLISTAYDPVFRAYPDHLPFLIKTRVALLAPLLAGLWWLTDRFGLLGAISVVVGVNAVERLVIAVKAARILEVSWRDVALLEDVGKLLLFAIAAAVASVAARQFVLGGNPLAVLALGGIVHGLVYLSLVILSGMVTRDFREALRPPADTAQESPGFAE